MPTKTITLRDGTVLKNRGFRFNDLTGNRYGHLRVLKIDGESKSPIRWICRCDCGKELSIDANPLKNGQHSCGCVRGHSITHGATTHGKRSREYVSWAAMKSRCLNPNNNRFHVYGARGIKICARWVDSFENFLSDMGKCPDGMSLERINTNGNYDPSNCKWGTKLEQANNKNTNTFIEHNGLTKTMAEWSRVAGIQYWTFVGRLKRGWTLSEAIKLPLRQTSANP